MKSTTGQGEAAGRSLEIAATSRRERLLSLSPFAIDIRLRALLARRHAVILALISVAVLIRLIGIAGYPLNGDEYRTLLGPLGLQRNAVAYIALMRAWSQPGNSDVWLRLPAVVFGALTVPVLFTVGLKLGGYRTGVAAALLAATSPFSIYHSQEVRFYTFFPFAVALFILVTVAAATARPRWTTLLLPIPAGLLLLFSYQLGVVALIIQVIVTVTVVRSSRPRWQRLTFALTLFGFMFLLPLYPPVSRLLWVLTGHGGTQVATAISELNLIKAAFALFVFTFGYHVYPGWLFFTAPGTVLVGALLVLGTAKMLRGRWALFPIAYLFALLEIFVVFDSIGGAIATGIAPRHAAFVWPAFLIVLAFGVAHLPRRFFTPVLGLLVCLNLFSLWPRWQMMPWQYGKTLTNYRQAAAVAETWASAETLILHDGRSQQPLARYFPVNVRRIDMWPYLEGEDLAGLSEAQRLILVNNHFGEAQRAQYDELLRRLATEFSVVDGYVSYPLFQYLLARQEAPLSDNAGHLEEQLRQPLEIYGIEFQDLALPIAVESAGSRLKVIGSFNLSAAKDNREQVVPLFSPRSAGRVVVLSNLLAGDALEMGQAVAELTVETGEGTSFIFPIRLGMETQSWMDSCPPTAPCATVYRWRKYIAFVGGHYYPGAYRDFQAGIHSATFTLPSEVNVSRISIRYLAGGGQLYVWGVAIPSP